MTMIDEDQDVSFDKFMDVILLDKKKKEQQIKQVQQDSPQRIRAARNQDRPLNKTVWK